MTLNKNRTFMKILNVPFSSFADIKIFYVLLKRLCYILNYILSRNSKKLNQNAQQLRSRNVQENV